LINLNSSSIPSAWQPVCHVALGCDHLRILRLVNFAYGELIMIGGYTCTVDGFTPALADRCCTGVAAAMFTSLFTELVAFAGAREVTYRHADHLFCGQYLLQNAACCSSRPRQGVTLPQISRPA